jgi:hypothetical protein
MCVAQEGSTSVGGSDPATQLWHKVIDYADGGNQFELLASCNRCNQERPLGAAPHFWSYCLLGKRHPGHDPDLQAVEERAALCSHREGRVEAFQSIKFDQRTKG